MMTFVNLSRAKTGFQREHWVVRIQHVRFVVFVFVFVVVGRSETAGDLECLGTFHKLKLLKMKFVIGKKRGTSRF